MVLPAVKKQILEDLDHLPPECQKQAADLVHRFVAELNQGAGTMDDRSFHKMPETEGDERVDENPEWQRRGFIPPRHPLMVTPAPKGSGKTDTALHHDKVFASRS